MAVESAVGTSVFCALSSDGCDCKALGIVNFGPGLIRQETADRVCRRADEFVLEGTISAASLNSAARARALARRMSAGATHRDSRRPYSRRVGRKFFPITKDINNGSRPTVDIQPLAGLFENRLVTRHLTRFPDRRQSTSGNQVHL
jgi:hypothetical protein